MTSYVENYPNPSTKWLDHYWTLCDKYKMQPAEMGHWAETHLHRGPRMTDEEILANIVRDFNAELVAGMAKDLGFDEERSHRVMRCYGHRTTSAKLSDVPAALPYTMSIHGKFYDMTEIPGQPGHYQDKGVDTEGFFKMLMATDWEGYVDSEFEGQRCRRDMGKAGLVDEIAQVRKHHEMLKRLIGE